MTSQSNPEALRILFVDDNDDMRAMMEILMQRQGYEVRTANSAMAALELAPAWQPHLLVSDIGMPGTDGYELLRALRADSRLLPFRAIALTGFGHLTKDGAGRAAGFDECFEKPVNFDKLFAAIEKLQAGISLDRLTNEDIPLPNSPDTDLDLNRNRVGF